MANDPHKRTVPVPSNAALPIDGRWAAAAAKIRSPLAGMLFGVRARANMHALRLATEHAKVVAELMDAVVETTGKVQRAQDVGRTFAVRQELSEQLRLNEIEQVVDTLSEAGHQRALTDKRRTQELIKADTEVLLARQTLRAKRKFEPLKHAIGEERFKTEAARRRVGAAEAHLAMEEAGAPSPSPSAGERRSGQADQAAVISTLLEGIRAKLKQMRADGEDGEERTALVAEEASLERILARLLGG